MIGAILGDIVGSIFEFNNHKSMEFEFLSEESVFTDDTVLTIATMDVLLSGDGYGETYKKWFRRYPAAGFAGMFFRWGFKDTLEPYNSWGNGSAMRVSPVGLWYDTLDQTRAAARASASATHNHPEGIKGAEATASAIFLARTGADKGDIKAYIEQEFGYDLSASTDSLRPWYRFDVSCKGTLPPALICFLESTEYENAIRRAISIGGDSDTIACIAGGMAEAFHGMPGEMKTEALDRLPADMREVVEAFYASPIVIKNSNR